MTREREGGMAYSDFVNYTPMDLFKVLAQQAARKTADNINRFGFVEIPSSRGESAYIVDLTNGFSLVTVEEGLGTKNLITDVVYALTGESYYQQIAQDTVAMIVNDLITVGALPISVSMHLAVEDASWFSDNIRVNDLIEGWKKACDLALCTWGGGETPTLKDIIVPGASLLSGSAFGFIDYRPNLLSGQRIKNNDVIIIVKSSGIHANGATMARKIAGKLPEGYLTKLPSGRSYGEVLLDPTLIYVPLINKCQKEDIEIHYGINITGHGWRKLMRAVENFAYIIEEIPVVSEIFDFIQEHGNVDLSEMYGNFNMGAGFALIVPRESVGSVCRIASELGFDAFEAGHVEKAVSRNVVIEPLGLEYNSEELKLR